MTQVSRVFYLSAFALGAMSLVACGGGGGGSNPTPTSVPTAAPSSAPSAKPSTAPSASPSASVATATGTVVDYAANTPLSGVSVSIAAYTAGAAATQVATTTASGTFSFTASPGTYLLIIGSNSPTDTTTTLHQRITLAAGANPLTFGVPPAEPNVTYTAAQSSGNFRLTALAGNQLSCLTGANSGRAAESLPLLVADESATEAMSSVNQQETADATDTPPLFGSWYQAYSISGGIGITTSEGFTTCTQWTGPSYSYIVGNPPYAYATDAASIWYGAQQTAGSYGAQAWIGDPR